VRVLRDPAELRASVDHAHLDLKDDARLAGRREGRGRAAVVGGGEEGSLDAAPEAVHVVLAEAVWQHARHTAVHLSHLCQLARLDDHAVDDVGGGDVLVALAAIEGISGAAQVDVVLDVHWPRVKPGGEGLLQQQRLRLCGGELHVLVLKPLLQHRQGERRSSRPAFARRRLRINDKPPLPPGRARLSVCGEAVVRVLRARVLLLHRGPKVELRHANLPLEAAEEGEEVVKVEGDGFRVLYELVVQLGRRRLRLRELLQAGPERHRELLG